VRDARDDQIDELEEQVRLARVQLEEALDTVRRRQAVVEELRSAIEELEAEHGEGRLRLSMLLNERERRSVYDDTTRDLLSLALEENSRDLGASAQPEVLLERLVHTARDTLQTQRAAPVALAIVRTTPASRRVLHNAGVNRRILEDVTRPLEDLAVRRLDTVERLTLPVPFDDQAVIVVARDELSEGDQHFVKMVALTYAVAAVALAAPIAVRDRHV
jgi:hypothetical protein